MGRAGGGWLMSALALVDVLPDFGVTQRPLPQAAERPAPRPEILPQPASQDFEAERIAAAVAQAETALAERLNAEHAEERSALEARHVLEMQHLQAEFGEQAGRLIGEKFAELENNVLALASSVVARILAVSLSEDVKRSAIEELRRSITTAIGDREAVRIRIRGPVSLFDALRPGLDRFAEQIEFSEAAGFDLAVSVDNTLFETRMAEWSSALSEVLT
jgi:hypothetical protein